jgi:hypothetical protein
MFKFRIGASDLQIDKWKKLIGGFRPEQRSAEVVEMETGIVCADFHFPYVDEDMFDKLIKIAQLYLSSPRILVIAGDLVDFSSISTFDVRDKDQNIDSDLNSARLGLNILSRTFDRIYYCMGNHDIRFLRKLEWFMSITEFGQSIFNSEKLVVVPEPYLYIVSNNTKFLVTHPSNYSRIGKVPVDLSAKYRLPVLSFHGHLFHIRSEPSGNDFGYDVGCMTRQDLHSYIHNNVTTHPEWTKGFCMIRNGSIFPFTSNPKLTGWSFWLEELPAKLKGGRL